MSYTNFMEWVIANGGRHFGVTIKDSSKEGGKGLFATRDFRENETVLCIPTEIIITAGFIAEIPGYSEFLKRCHLKPYEVLTYFFLVERQKNSKWAPYLNVLPNSFLTPANLYFNLKPEDFPYYLREQWREQKNELKSMYEKFVAMLADGMSWNNFLWAWHIVNTRCIYRDNKPHPLIDNSQGDSVAIVPLIDMFNHSNESQCCAIWDSKLNLYKVVVTRPVHEGEQMFICYGSHTNGSLWIEYGFSLKDNICNKVDIPLEDFMRLASAAGIIFSDLHRKIVLQASFPCCIYATDVKPNFGLKANLALLKMSFSKLENWTKVIYEEAGTVTDSDVLVIVRLLRDQIIRDGNNSSQQTRWLWDEQITLLHAILNIE